MSGQAVSKHVAFSYPFIENIVIAMRFCSINRKAIKMKNFISKPQFFGMNQMQPKIFNTPNYVNAAITDNPHLFSRARIKYILQSACQRR